LRGMDGSTEVWMAVTADEYQLPLSVADTCAELGRNMGVSASALLHLSRAFGRSMHEFNGVRYMVVRVKTDWSEDNAD